MYHCAVDLSPPVICSPFSRAFTLFSQRTHSPVSRFRPGRSHETVDPVEEAVFF
jgi:hypothetical protein